MITIAWPSHLLRVGDLTCMSLAGLLDLAERMKAEPNGWSNALAGQALVYVSNGASTHTRLAAESAAARLGMVPVAMRLDELELERYDTIDDVGRTLSSYAGAVVARNVDRPVLAALARAATVPIINGHSPTDHPCQALADLLTLREHFGSLEDLALAYVGAANCVLRSLMAAAALAGMDVRVACPPEHGPSEEDSTMAAILAERHGGSVTVVADPYEAVAGADAVYTAPWPDELRDNMEAYRVDARLMRHARPSAVFMHCLPVRRRQEVARTVIDGPHSIVWEQIANALPTEEAVIYALSTAKEGTAS